MQILILEKGSRLINTEYSMLFLQLINVMPAFEILNLTSGKRTLKGLSFILKLIGAFLCAYSHDHHLRQKKKQIDQYVSYGFKPKEKTIKFSR